MWRSLRDPHSIYRNSTLTLEWAEIKERWSASSTCSSLLKLASLTPDQVSAVKRRLFTRIAFRRRRPTSTLRRPMSTSLRMPMIVATFPHPLFLLSSIVSAPPPSDVTILPKYFTESASCMTVSCTCKIGHGVRHLVLFPTCITTLFSLDNVSFWVSMKEFITEFSWTACLAFWDAKGIVDHGCVLYSIVSVYYLPIC